MLLASALAAGLWVTPLGAQGGAGGLSVEVEGRWVPWPAGRDHPAVWSAPDALVAGAVAWRPVAPGVEQGEMTLRGGNAVWRLRVILVRMDPALLAFRVVVPPRRDDGFSGRWSVDEAPDDALVAVNAGQFTGGPWGWLVQGGVRRQPPGSGALAPGVAFEAGGRVELVPPDSLHAVGWAQEGFQSYPTLLEGDGRVPGALRASGLGVDLTHRDSRLALGVLRDGRVVLALTRFVGLGELLEVVPFGPTTPEMAALMGALGCSRAVLLDGGISGQLLVRGDGSVRRWTGLRKVAAGLVVTSRSGTRR